MKTFIWLKNSWLLLHRMLSSFPQQWKWIFLRTVYYVQIKPDLVVIALDKCHSNKWSNVVSFFSLDELMPLFCLICDQQNFSLWIFFILITLFYCVMFEAASPLHSGEYFHHQKVKLKFNLSSFGVFYVKHSKNSFKWVFFPLHLLNMKQWNAELITYLALPPNTWHTHNSTWFSISSSKAWASGTYCAPWLCLQHISE